MVTGKDEQEELGGAPDALKGACPVRGKLGGNPLLKDRRDAVLLFHPRASSHAPSRRGVFIVLVLLSLCGTGAHLSWGQESVLGRGPIPESVFKLNSPLDFPFLPLAPIPWAFTTLRDSL